MTSAIGLDEHAIFITCWSVVWLSVFCLLTIYTGVFLGLRSAIKVFPVPVVSHMFAYILFYSFAPKFTLEDRYPVPIAWLVQIIAALAILLPVKKRENIMFVFNCLLVFLSGVADTVLVLVFHGLWRPVPTRIFISFSLSSALCGILVATRRFTPKEGVGCLMLTMSGTNLCLFIEALKGAYFSGCWNVISLGYLGIGCLAGCIGPVTSLKTRKDKLEEWAHEAPNTEFASKHSIALKPASD
jgi:hypothetical protein